MVDDIGDPWQEIRRLRKDVDRLMNARPLEAASVTNGRVRFIGGTLRVDSGGRLEVVGTLDIDGATTVSGSFSVEGPWTISGDGSITGDVTVTGPMTVSGTLDVDGDWTFAGNGDITGDVDLTGELNVEASGRIKAGVITIDPSADGGAVDFGSGRRIHAGSGFLGIYNGGAFVAFNSSGVSISGTSGPVVRVGPAGVRMSGLPTKTATSVPGSFAGALSIDASGDVYRII